MKSFSELDDDSYRLGVEKIIGLILFGAVFAIWCNGVWGTPYSLIADYMGSIKIGIFGMSCFIAARVFPKGVVCPAVICLGLALVYNPFIALKLNADNWVVINFIASLAAAWSELQLFKVSRLMSPDRVKNMRLAEERAKAIEEALADGRLDREKYDEYFRTLTGLDK